MDRELRDYFFDLLKSASPATREYILTALYGRFEGQAMFGDTEPLMTLIKAIQAHTDVDHGIA